MAKRKSTAPETRPACLELPAVLARFMDARCVLECGVRCLEDRHDRAASDEAACLRHALNLMASVYDELDRAAMRERL